MTYQVRYVKKGVPEDWRDIDLLDNPSKELLDRDRTIISTELFEGCTVEYRNADHWIEVKTHILPGDRWVHDGWGIPIEKEAFAVLDLNTIKAAATNGQSLVVTTDGTFTTERYFLEHVSKWLPKSE